jgi:hypothetical protein
MCSLVSSYNLRKHVAFALSLHVESKATMIRGNAPRADVSSAQRDVPEHVPGSAGTAEDPPRITTCADGGWNRSQSGYLLRDEAADA